MAYIDDLLARGEKIQYIGRQHTFVLVSNILTELFLIAVLIAAGVVSQAAFPDRVIGDQSVGVLVMAICAVISLLLVVSAVLDYIRWNNEQYVITDQRVIQVRGIVNKNVSDSSLEKINDVMLTQSWLGRIFQFGDIEIITGSDMGVNYMHKIGSPLEFKRAMMEAKQHAHRGFGYIDPETMAAYLSADEQQRSPQTSVEESLRRLTELRNQGLLSPEEYEAKRREVLSRI